MSSFETNPLSCFVGESVALHCDSGGSNKVWAGAAVKVADGRSLLLTCWGAAGSSLQAKAYTLSSLEGAVAELRKKSKEKRGKGYHDIALASFALAQTLRALATSQEPSFALEFEASDEALAPVSVISAPSLGVGASHVTPLPIGELEHVLGEGEMYGVTEKVNGTRCLIRCDGQNLTAFNRQGVPLPLPPQGALPLVGLSRPFLVDGERLEREQAGSYVLFDLLELDGGSIREWPYQERIAKLEQLLQAAELFLHGGATMARSRACAEQLFLLTPATTPADKQMVLEEVRQGLGEGIIVRTLNGPSLAGETRYERKFKLTASVDVVMLGVEPGMEGGSIRMGLVRPTDGALISVGKLRSGLRASDIARLEQQWAAGTPPVLEVSFLVARTVGLALVEPVFQRARVDKQVSECTTTQLIEVLGASRQAQIEAAVPVGFINEQQDRSPEAAV